MSSIDPRFDLLDELPRGRLAIQASAGTGKTFTLAALATRFVAEVGVPTSELLIVTFTRAATSELRARVRDRMVAAAEHLRAHLEGADPSSDDAAQSDAAHHVDALEAHLAAVDPELRLGRLVRAITEFDAATITTIHGFATQVLATLGVSADVDPTAALVDDSAQLAAECCADVLAAAALDQPLEVLPTFETLVKRTRTAINIADLRLTPDRDQDAADQKSRLLVELVTRVDRRDASTSPPGDHSQLRRRAGRAAAGARRPR